jgi:threonine dehydrogenase-like Zn-dependent dehydrogenase
MRGVVMYGPGDIRVEERENPVIVEPTDAVIRLPATSICGSDLWPYRGDDHVDHAPMGHEYAGVVTEIGANVRAVKVGDFVVGSFFASDNTCEICAASRHPRRPAARRGTDHCDEPPRRRTSPGPRSRIKELTGGLGAHSVIEAVGTQESMMQAIRATRPDGHVGYVGVSHDVELPGGELFFSAVHLHGGPAPVRRFRPISSS